MCAGVMVVRSAFRLRRPESSSYAIVNVLVKPNVSNRLQEGELAGKLTNDQIQFGDTANTMVAPSID